MSRRTAPHFSPPLRHPYPPSSPPPPLQTPLSATRSLFSALDRARFHEVRRALAAHPPAIHASHPFSPSQHLKVVDYALNRCYNWLALFEHCQRTGMSVPTMEGGLTIRERLGAMNLIVGWLVENGGEWEMKMLPLHTAIRCGFELVVGGLIERGGEELIRGVDKRGKGGLHVVGGMVGGGSMEVVVGERLIGMLVKAGGRVNQRDVDGRTPMHELVGGICGREEIGYGLRRRGGRGLGGIVGVIDTFLKWGGDVYAEDAEDVSVLEMAVQGGGDYLVVVERMNVLYERIVGGGDWGGKWKNMGGFWGGLPEEVIVRIVGFMAPVEAVCGIGESCIELRRIVLSEEVWMKYETSFVMESIRGIIRRGAERDRKREGVVSGGARG